MQIEPRPRHWDRFRAAASDCVRAGPAGAALDGASVGDLCSAVEYMCCDALNALPQTRRYWLDGVEPKSLDVLRDNLGLVVRGQAWCADRSRQWLVPCEIEATFSSGVPDRCFVRLGNGAFTCLDQHRTERATRPQVGWLHAFEFVPRQPDPSILPRYLAELHAWVSSHAEDLALVGHDWSYISPAEAEAFIRDQVTAGRQVVLEETWLDGRDALRVHGDG